jgi:CRP-like cAMP-binding protein
MVTTEELRKIVILTYLTEAMLETLVPIIEELQFQRDDIVFQQDDPADRFYMVHSGKIILEQAITPEVTVCVGSIKPGYSFGWSAMLQRTSYRSDATCVEPSEVYSFTYEHIKTILAADPEMGYRLYQRLLVILKKRYDKRTEQLRQTVLNHPDMNALFNR